MRTLPESASLDHVRRQAKELLLAIFRRSEGLLTAPLSLDRLERFVAALAA